VSLEVDSSSDTFSEDMDPSYITRQSFKLYKKGSTSVAELLPKEDACLLKAHSGLTELL